MRARCTRLLCVIIGLRPKKVRLGCAGDNGGRNATRRGHRLFQVILGLGFHARREGRSGRARRTRAELERRDAIPRSVMRLKRSETIGVTFRSGRIADVRLGPSNLGAIQGATWVICELLQDICAISLCLHGTHLWFWWRQCGHHCEIGFIAVSETEFPLQR